MSLQLDQQIRNLEHGEHACLIFENAVERMAAVVPFIQAGLDRQDLCLYLNDEAGAQKVREALEAGGIAVQEALEAGRLRMVPREEVFGQGDEADAGALTLWLEKQLEAALRAGFGGLRITGELCPGAGQPDHAQLIARENDLNRSFPDRPLLALCQFQRRNFPAALLRDVLRCHPIAVLGDQVCTNAFYEPPEVIDSEDDTIRLDWKIKQLQRSRASEQALQELNSQLETANARKDEFLAMLGHELRNPLAAINNGISLLGLGTLDAAARAQVQSTIEHQMKNITRLVDDLLDVARVTRGKISLTREPLDLRQVIRGAVDSLEPEFQTRRHVLELSLPDEKVCVLGDETRLEQVFTNVLENALRYTPADGKISVHLGSDGNKATLRITDTGVGMPADLVRNVFELFAQGERGLSRTEGGLGVGLTLARTLTELHEGSIEVKSGGAGQGTTVIVRLPETTAARQEQAQPAPATQARNLHVLLVEDNEAVAQTLAMLIEQLGQRVTVAPDGETALDQARALMPDLVLLDIGLPGMNGYDVCKRLRSLYGNEVPIVALTGYGASERSQEARFSQYCTKPLSLNALLSLINEVQQTHQRRRQPPPTGNHVRH